VLIEPSCEHAHNADAEVDDAAHNAQLGFVHIVILLHGLCAGWENAVVKVDEDIGEDHECEGEFGRTIVFDSL